MRILSALILIFVYALVLCSVGCQSIAKQEQLAIDKANVAIGSIGEDFATISTEAANIRTADPSNATVQAHVKTIGDAVAAGKNQLAPLNDQVTKASKILAAYIIDEDELTWWISLPIRHAAWWIGAGAVVFAVLLVVLDGLKGFANPVGTIASWVFSFATLYFKEITGAIGSISDSIVAKMRGVPKATVVAQSVPASTKAAVLATAISTPSPAA